MSPWRSLLESLKTNLSTKLSTDLAKILAAALVLRVAGLVWGMPASDGWDDDGVAPRDYLVGVLETYWPGHHATYPPLHLLVLAAVSAPVWIAALLRAPSFAPEAVVQAFIGVPTMTAMAIVGRAVSVVLSLGTLWGIAQIAQEVRGSTRAGLWAAAACGANAVFTYYSQTSNLDVPYLFWSVLSVRALVAAMARSEPARLRQVPVLAALGIATKDQAYALFVCGVPLALGAWLVLDPRARARLRVIVGEISRGAFAALVLLVVIDGGATNPGGFVARLRFLLGSASQDHAFFAATWQGRLSLVREIGATFHEHYPWLFVPLVVLGLAVASRAPDPARRAAGLVPMWVALSFTLAFNLAARRTEHRFVLPHTLMAGFYAGVALDALQGWLAGPGRSKAFWLVAGGLMSSALFQCAAVCVAMVRDPRYDAEAWLRARVRPGDRIEVYDSNVHLPRLPPGAVVARVDPKPLEGRSPLPDLIEVRDRLGDVEARRPRFLVVSDFIRSAYLVDPVEIERLGRVLSTVQSRALEDSDTGGFFRALFERRLGYEPVHVSEYDSRIWPPVWTHASLCRTIWIFERTPAAGQATFSLRARGCADQDRRGYGHGYPSPAPCAARE